MTDDTPKILIIDDNEDILAMIKIMLEMSSYSVSVKMSIPDPEDYIGELLPDLIVMDMLLSGADGREICKTLKNNPELAHIPILMISAHPTAKQECLQAGADFYLGKPFSMQDFLQAVEKLLSPGKE